MHFFTSITSNYLPKARVLGKTLKEHNSDAVFAVVLSDRVPEDFSIDDEPFDIVFTLEDVKSVENIHSFRFKYNITELCTAVKPGIAKQLMEDYGAEKVAYIDPDIGVFDSLDTISELLNDYSMVFTPHQTSMENSRQFIVGNEILFLKKGSMNLGFFAVKNDDEGKKFLDWWSSRLMEFAFDDNLETIDLLKSQGLLGMFTDQKWIDLVPSFFDNYYILKNPGYNVSTWNLTTRVITKNNGKYFVDNEPLKFFHFSSFDSKHHHSVLELVLEVNPDNRLVRELSKWYLERLKETGQDEVDNSCYSNGSYDNGVKITDVERKLYLIRKDIHEYFPNPFQTDVPQPYYYWVRGEYSCYFDDIETIPTPISKKEALKVLLGYDSGLYKSIRLLYRKVVRTR